MGKRKPLERNQRTGQFSGDLPVEIGKVAKQMATEYFERFNTVDVFDLIVKFEIALHYVGALTNLKETDKEIKENENYSEN